MPNFARMMYTGIIGRRRVSLVEPPICERCGSVLLLQAKHVAYARVVRHAHADVALILRSEEHTSELQSLAYLVCRLLLEKKKRTTGQDERASPLAAFADARQ